MNEDAQPNERPWKRKGGTVPTIRPTQAGRGRGALQCGGYGSMTRYYQTPLNGPQTETCPIVTSHNYPHHSDPSKLTHHSPDGPYTKRRRTIHESSTESHAPHEEAVASPLHLPKPANRPRKSTKRKAQPEPIELLVEIPSACRKGTSDSQHLRRQWQSVQVQELSAKTGVPLRFGGYTQGCARFIIDEIYGSQPEERSGRPKREERTSSLLPVQSVSPPASDIITNNMNDEIIVVENVDDLGDVQSSLLPFSPVRSEHEPDLPHPSPPAISELPRLKPPELLEPPRVFRSGVLSLSSTEGDTGSVAFHATPLGTEISSFLRPSGDMVPCASSTDDTSSLFQVPELAKRFGIGLPNTGMTSILNQTPSSSTVCARDSFNHEIETLENPNGNEPSSRYKLIAEDSVSIQLPLSQSDKIRRILHSDTTSVLTLSMRGSVDLSDVPPLRHRRTLKTSKPGDLVDDACLLRAGDEHIAIFGHARDQGQLTWCRFRLDTTQNETLPLPRPWNSVKKGGVSALASMMQHLQFATGGYDHIVHLWEVKPDFSSVSPRPLAIKHTSQVQALLAIRDTSHKLVSAGSDCNVHVWDLSSERVVNTLRPSNAPYHLHPTASPFCTLLEVAHRELQFEVRDHRLVPECPVLRFGYNTDKVHGRFIKGATSSDLFACGSRDGRIRLWDLRNVKFPPVTTTTHPGQKLVQTVFEQSRLIVCSEGGQLSLVRYDEG